VAQVVVASAGVAAVRTSPTAAAADRISVGMDLRIVVEALLSVWLCTRSTRRNRSHNRGFRGIRAGLALERVPGL
jgi:hypothetical protein